MKDKESLRNHHSQEETNETEELNAAQTKQKDARGNLRESEQTMGFKTLAWFLNWNKGSMLTQVLIRNHRQGLPRYPLHICLMTLELL